MTTTRVNQDLDHLLDNFSRRLQSVEQRLTSPGTIGAGGDRAARGEFDEIYIGPAGNMTRVWGPVSPPTGLTLVWGSFFDTIYIDATWTPPADGTAVAYQIDFAKKVAGSYQTVRSSRVIGTSVRIEPVEADTIYAVRVSALNRISRESTPTAWVEITTGRDSSVPPTVTGVTAEAGYKSAVVKWSESGQPADVIDGNGLYQVQISTSATFATILDTRRISGTIIGFDNLTTGTTYYFRVAAIDSSANQGPYSGTVSATPGTVPSTEQRGDGAAPTSSPAPVITNGIGYLYAEWTKITNNDPVTYEIHISTVSGFTPTTSTKSGESDGSFFFIERDGAGTPLAYGTTYYVKIVAKDRDGSASAGTQSSGVPQKVASGDVNNNAIGADQLASGAVTKDKVGFSVGGGNRVKNSSIEAGVGDWQVTNGTMAVATSPVRHGAQSAQVTSTGSSTWFGRRDIVAQRTPVSPGVQYTVSVYVRPNSTVRTAHLYIYEYNSSGVTQVTHAAVGAVSEIAGDWIRVKYTITAGANTAFLGYIVQWASIVSGEIHFVDGWQIEEGDIATAYAPMPDEILPGSVGSAEIADAAITKEKVNFTIGGGNAVPNSSVEMDTAGWSASATTGDALTTQRVTTQKLHGVASWEANVTAVGSNSTHPRLQAPATQALWKVGDKVVGSLWVKAPVGATMAFAMMESGSTRFQGPTVSGTGSWQRLVGVHTVATGTEAAPVNLQTYLQIRTVGVYYLDGSQVEQGDVVTAYAPKPDEIYPGSITATEIADNAVTTPKIIAEAIVAGKIAASAITTDKLAALAITAEKISASAVVADKIAAGAVTTEKLTVGSMGDSRIPNGGFEDASGADATKPANWSQSGGAAADWTRSNASSSAGAYSLAMVAPAASSNTRVLATTYVPVTGNETWFFSARVRASVATTIGFYFRIRWYTSAQALISNSDVSANIGLTTEYQSLAAQFTAPATAAYFLVELMNTQSSQTGAVANTTYVDEVEARKVTVSAQIADGAITTDKLIANAIVAAKIAASAITTDKLAALAITAEKISAGAVVADKIAAGAITTEKLTVGSISDNAVLNSGFEDVSGANATRAASWTYDYENSGAPDYGFNTATPDSGTRSLAIAPTASTSGAFVASKSIPVVGGEIWHISMRAWTSVATTNGRYLRVVFGTTEDFVRGSAISITDIGGANLAFTAAPTRYEGQITVPSTAKYMRVVVAKWATNVAATGYFDDVEARKVTVSAHIADGAITTDKLIAGAVTAAKIAAGTITANEIAANTITAAKIAALTITANELAANTITAAKIAAGAITTEKLTVVNFGSTIIANASFEEVQEANANVPARWTSATTGAASVTTSTVVANVHGGERSVALAVTTAGAGNESRVAANRVPVVGGDTYEFSVWVRASVATTNGCYLRVRWFKPDGTASATAFTDVSASTPVATVWGQQIGSVVVPSDASRADIELYNSAPNVASTFYFDDLVFRQAVVSASIKDGAIVANKIAAGSISSDKIVTAGLDAATIKFGTMSGDRITANTLDVQAIKTSTLTTRDITLGAGGQLKAGNPPTTGLLINDQGISLYANSTRTVFLDAVTGAGTFTGTVSGSTVTGSTISGGTITGATFRTVASGHRVEISSSGGGYNEVRFYTGSVGELDPPRMFGLTGGDLVFYGINRSGYTTSTIRFEDPVSYAARMSFYADRYEFSCSGHAQRLFSFIGANVSVGDNLAIGTGVVDFGSTTRQMIHLWGGGTYGIGVQSNTLYQRTNLSFGWYKGGVHSDTTGAAGTGGVVLAILNGNGNLTTYGAAGSNYDGNNREFRAWHDKIANVNTVAGICNVVPGWAKAQLWVNSALGDWLEVVNAAGSATTTIRAAAFNVSSSAKTKFNIRSLDPVVALEHVKRMRPVKFRRPPISTERQPRLPNVALYEDSDYAGMVAEEMGLVCPEAVSYGPDMQPDGIDYAAITAHNTGAIQGLAKLIDQLRAELDALKGQFSLHATHTLA